MRMPKLVPCSPRRKFVHGLFDRSARHELDHGEREREDAGKVGIISKIRLRM